MAGLEAGLEAILEIGIERKCETDTWLGGEEASRKAGLEAMEIAAKEALVDLDDQI